MWNYEPNEEGFSSVNTKEEVEKMTKEIALEIHEPWLSIVVYLNQ